jgi:LytR cell envelope-related transcriptional attenuator
LVPRRRRGRFRWSVLLLVLVALAAVGYVGDRYVWPHLHSSTPTAAPVSCPRSTPAPPLPAAKSVSLRVRNATLREGLASQVASSLHHRGFHVRGVGNTSARVTGTAAVRYSADRAQQAKALAAQVDAPVLVRVAGKGVLDLDLGPKWHSLASVAAARAAERADRRARRPTPTCTPSSGVSSRG